MDSLPALEPGDTVATFTERAGCAFRVTDLGRISTPSMVRTAVARGHLTTVLPGFVAHSAHAASFQVRVHAATRWADGPAIGQAALFAWGLLREPPRTIDVAVSHDRRPRSRPGYRVSRTRRLPAEKTVWGLRVVTPAEAVVTGWGDVPQDMRAEVLYRAVRERRVTARQLERALASTSRVPQRRQLERRIAAAAAGAASFLEEVSLWRVFTGERFVGFLRQYEVVVEGERFVLDMYHHETRICVELDGTRFHAGSAEWQRAIHRDAMLASVGIQTIRLSYADITDRPEWCRRVVLQTMEARQRR